MLKITEEIREGARRLLARHNRAEPDRAEKRYRAGIAFRTGWLKPGQKLNETGLERRSLVELPPLGRRTTTPSSPLPSSPQPLFPVWSIPALPA